MEFSAWLSLEVSQQQIIHKPNQLELSFLFETHSLIKMNPTVKFHDILLHHFGVKAGTQILGKGG